MATNYALESGFLDDVYEGRGLSGKIPNRNYGLEVEFEDPAIDATTVAYVKGFNNINTDAYDDYLEDYIESALVDIEKYTGRTIIQRTVTAYWKRVWTDLWIPYPDVQSITSVTSIDDSGNETVLTTDDYTELGDKQKYLSFLDYSGTQIKIVYVAGYGTTMEELPINLRNAISRQVMFYFSDFAETQEVIFDQQTQLEVKAKSLASRYVVHQ